MAAAVRCQCVPASGYRLDRRASTSQVIIGSPPIPSPQLAITTRLRVEDAVRSILSVALVVRRSLRLGNRASQDLIAGRTQKAPLAATLALPPLCPQM